MGDQGSLSLNLTERDFARFCNLPNLVNSKNIREAALCSVSLPLNHKIPPLRAIPNKSMSGGGNIVPDITYDV